MYLLNWYFHVPNLPKLSKAHLLGPWRSNRKLRPDLTLGKKTSAEGVLKLHMCIKQAEEREKGPCSRSVGQSQFAPKPGSQELQCLLVCKRFKCTRALVKKWKTIEKVSGQTHTEPNIQTKKQRLTPPHAHLSHWSSPPGAFQWTQEGKTAW